MSVVLRYTSAFHIKRFLTMKDVMNPEATKEVLILSGLAQRGDFDFEQEE